MNLLKRRTFPLVALLLAGCSGTTSATPPEPTVGVRAFFDATVSSGKGPAGRWLSFPYPSDHRRAANGNIKLSDFPNPDRIELLSSYLVTGEASLNGFSTAGAVHAAFDGPLDVAPIPTDMAAFLLPDAPLQIVDITAGSPEYGKRRPLRWEYRDHAGKYVAADSLAAAPAWGFPLRERTTYAFLATSALKGKDGNPVRRPELLRALLDPTSPGATTLLQDPLNAQLAALYAPLRKLLAEEKRDPASVVVATVFTTQDVTSELASVHDQVQQGPPPARKDEQWATPEGAGAKAPTLWASRSYKWNSTQTVDYWVMEGRYTTPNYQRGEIPYLSEGGGFVLEKGVPKKDHDEEIRFVLTIPKKPPPAGTCYPVVQIAHGTGGSAYGLIYSEAGRHAARGMAAISIDQPMHGPRGLGRSFDIDRMSFNFLNPEGARTLFRQSAIDTFVLTRFVRESLRVPAGKSPTGQGICFDRERSYFFGHSQGGLSGALAASFEEHVKAWVLSGAAGGLTLTLMVRKDVLDIEAAVSTALGLQQDEKLSDLHPALTIVQTLVDITDEINYSRLWLEHGDPSTSSGSLMMTSGRHDAASPYRGAIALAVAAKIPVVAPVAIPVPEFALEGLAPAIAPVKANLGARTAGFLQWTDDVPGKDWDSHFVIFDRPEAINASLRFLQTAAFEGGPVIERDVNADVR